MPATLNLNGSVTVDGVTLTAAQVSAINSARLAPPVSVKRPLNIVTGSGRSYGQSGTPRYGLWFDGSAWHYLNSAGDIIPGTSWKPRNLNRCTFKFST